MSKAHSTRFPLRLVLVFPFVVQIIVVVGLVGYLSYHTGQKAVEQLANELMTEQGNLINQHLRSYMGKGQEINHTNLIAFKTGLLDLDNSKALGEYFYQQSHLFNFSFVNFGGENGSFIGAGYAPDVAQVIIAEIHKSNLNLMQIYSIGKQGNRKKVIKTQKNPQARNAPWYTDAVKMGQPIWSSIYTWGDIPDTMAISASSPVYDKQQKILGVFGIDIELNQFSKFLQQLKGDRSGNIFIVERSGLIVATSAKESPAPVINGKAKRLNALNSQELLVRSVTKDLIQRYGNLKGITKLELLHPKLSQSPFVQVIPYRDEYGLDWLIVNIVPESEFLEEIHANLRRTWLLCALALVIAILIGVWTSRRIASPLFLLSQATQDIADGKLDQPLKSTRILELETLSESFRQMVDSLLQAQKLRQNYQQDLEKQVVEKTASLQTTLKELSIAKEKAEVANQEKSTFLANMSHELRTPLNSILGFSQIMMRSKILPLEEKENIAIVSKSADYLLVLINNVLDLSKIEAGKTTLNFREFDLYHLLQEIEDLLYLKAKNKGLELSFERDHSVPQYIYADQTKLRQVLINLIDNGIKFTSKGSIFISVTSTQLDNKVDTKQEVSFDKNLLFIVKDTGVGIAKTELDKLFKVFVQTESGKQTQEGTGLGLPISQKFVQLMGGNIAVKSKMNKGATFTFNIKARAVEHSLIETNSNKHIISLKPNQPRYKILIVDDLPNNRLLLKKLIQPLGFEVKEANNGKEAIEKWETWQPHLIFMDIRMPVMDGYETTKYIKEKGTNTIIIALTASVLEEEKAMVLSAGCDDFIRKPFQELTIFESMAKHLGVEYICEQKSKLAQVELQPEDLTVMSQEWLKQLHYASKILDDDLILNLIEKIPESHFLLADKLTHLVNDFQLKKIKEFIEKNGVI